MDNPVQKFFVAALNAPMNDLWVPPDSDHVRRTSVETLGLEYRWNG